MKSLTFSQILAANARFPVIKENAFSIRVLSNIVTSQLSDVLEYSLRDKGIGAVVHSGNYDNIVQDSVETGNARAVVVFWELANLIDGFQYKADLMEEADLQAFVSGMKDQIDLTLNNLRSTPLVIFNRFSSLIFTSRELRSTKLDWVCDQLNQHVSGSSQKNLALVDIEKALATVSIAKAVDMRFFYSSKSLYTVEFFKEYCELIQPVFLSVEGKTKKVLVFDCDNTLWQGVVGEDGATGLAMSAESQEGAVFKEVQSLAKRLGNDGVLIGLCSKNNATDVQRVLDDNPAMTLGASDIVARKINWNDKAANLKAMAEELNLGLDSFVFVDDSSFETDWVREQLPEVMVLQVPQRLHQYPQMVREAAPLFFNISQSSDDTRRRDMYREQMDRDRSREGFHNIEDYLRSLDLKLAVFTNEEGQIPRVAQLTQKTNQFNLTTKRYTETDIGQLIDSGKGSVVTFSLEDKVGDYGLTGLAILEVDRETGRAVVDSFLMSCRVIGRQVEFVFADEVLRYLKDLNVSRVEAHFRPTDKNSQVQYFYDEVGFSLVKESEKEKIYTLELAQHKFKAIDFVEVNHG